MSDKSSTKSSLTVTQFTNKVKEVICKNFNLNIEIEGEISNLKISNGNSYLTLKDENSSVSAIMWGNKIDFSNGDNVIIIGKINIYNKTGCYNIIISKIKKVGLGDIYKAYEKKKDIYFKKGYFEESNKKKLKNNIESVGIVTATGGAAIKDILYVLKKNKFIGNIIIKNCKVQGSNSSQSISNSIDYFSNQEIKVDVVLITRGGGSFEDLMGFSEDNVINAIHRCPILTISAVGHEIDTMLSDYVADIRAPTPSIAGEIICKYQKYNMQILNDIKNELSIYKDRIFDKLDSYENTLFHFNNQLKSTNINNIIDDKISHLKKMMLQCDDIVKTSLLKYENIIEQLKIDLTRFDNDKMLLNGYCLIVDDKYNIVDTKKEFSKKVNSKKLKIIFNDGEINVMWKDNKSMK